MRRGGLDDVPRADHIDPQDAFPHLVGHGVEVVVGDHGSGTGVVHDDVEPSVVLDRSLDELRGARGVGHVGLDVDGVGKIGCQLLAGCDRRRGVDHDASAAFGECAGHRGTDPARRAGDDRDLALQVDAHGACSGDWMGW
jgi:hypothetical protein